MGLVASSPEGCGLPRIVTLVDLVVVPVFYAMAAGVANAMPNRWKARSFSFAISVLMALACSFIAAAAHRMFTDGVFSVNLQICVGQTCISQGNERPQPNYHAMARAASLLCVSAAFVCVQLQVLLEDGAWEDFVRFLRRQRASGLLAPKPKVVMCDDPTRAAPGECAICLELLCRHPPAKAGGGTPSRAGEPWTALRLPCSHTFHEACIGRWIEAEISCPLCRASVAHLGRCTRLEASAPSPLGKDIA